MITHDEVVHYIQNIPAAPSVVRNALAFARAGDLIKAAKCASEDPALRLYLKVLVNRPIYGFKNEISDVGQIFGILGVAVAQQTLYNYSLSLLVPKKWELFNLDNTQFNELQASFSRHWEKILVHLAIKDKEIYSAISLIPATIIVCDNLFGSRKKDVDLLRSIKALDYNTILKRLSGYDLFALAAQIGQMWEMNDKTIALIRAASGTYTNLEGEEKLLAQWMHLLIFYELSQSKNVSAGLNEFIDFQIDFVQDIYDSFAKVVPSL